MAPGTVPYTPLMEAIHDQSNGERLQRVLAAAGVGPRRACERMIEEGRVKVNGQTVRRLPAFADPRRDRITVDGQPVARGRARAVYVMVNKPERTLVTRSDEPGLGRTTVMDLVDHPARDRLFPVGRLDFNTAGLVLLTTDGAMANRLTHPRYGVPKVYRVLVKGAVDPGTLQRVRGSMLKDLRRADRAGGRVKPAGTGSGLELRIAGREEGKTVLEVQLSEGRTGNLAKMLDGAGLAVRKLERTAIGPLRLTGLARGRWRELERDEVRALRDAGREHPSGGKRRKRGPRTIGTAAPKARHGAQALSSGTQGGQESSEVDL
jgi:23S rRNA pseudouridine2605 synthase